MEKRHRLIYELAEWRSNTGGLGGLDESGREDEQIGKREPVRQRRGGCMCSEEDRLHARAKLKHTRQSAIHKCD